MDDKVEKKLFWRVLLTGAILVLIIIPIVFAGFPFARKQIEVWYCDSRLGFCEDTTTETSVKRNAQGNIIERIDITKNQSGKTFWDWLGLAGTLAIPVLIVVLGYQFQHRDQKRAEEQANTEKERAEEQAKVERDIASENLRDEALQAYIDRMSELLLDRDLIRSSDDDPVRDVARTRTLTILRRLQSDGERKARVLFFLYDAGLLEIRESAPLIYLDDADFGEVNLKGAYLEGAYLEGANLTGASLMYAILGEANLKKANLMSANLMSANLMSANLISANLDEANLERAYLMYANLKEADLLLVNLKEANLISANLIEAYLAGANLLGANLLGANLLRANLEGVKNCTPDQIKAAKNWDKAHYSPEFRQQLGLSPKSEPSKSGSS